MMKFRQLHYDTGTAASFFLVLTKNEGSSKLGVPYHMKYIDTYGNICTWYSNCPRVISNSFTGSNLIVMHNQLHQDSLELEKKKPMV